ncbi:MAG: aminopeptidase N [Gammaproteobacteria bacterium]|uniref:Aminopeptidase N n=1 Tax=Candidatus Thiopontia autotrophica TaxID=2841688 RepID=A0A8J6TXY6_9GAMM|nr:aminopeptidase N [Candidatus Thiopontia autotrophica]
MTSPTPETTYLSSYTPPNHLVPEVRLFFDLGEDETRVKASLKIVASPDGESGAPLVLSGGGQELISLQLDGASLGDDRFQRDGDTLTISDVPDEFVLQMETRLYPKKNKSLEGLYRSGPIFCTQCEAEGFRKIIFFPDRPDVMSKFSVTIAADPKLCPVMLSNGNQTGHSGYPDGRHWVSWEDPFPKPAYLFALVAGKLQGIQDQFKTASGRDVTLRIFTEPHNVDKCDHAMVSLRRSMAWDEKVYGREYDLDLFNIVAVDDFNSGAMENKSLNIFNSKFVLARPETATDVDYLNIEAVIGHEYFHNWTGNRITCRDWFQLSLKEGLTVFRDQEFTADHNSRAVKRIQDVRLLRSAQFVEDSGPMSHPVRPDHYIEIRNFYTVTVYEKGAEVVRMQHALLGEESWRKGMDLYFKRHDGQAVTVEDFVRCMEEASGRDLSHFMSWYRQKGTPQLQASWSHDPESETMTLTLEQLPPESLSDEEREGWQPHHIPVAVGILSATTGEDLLPETTRMVELQERSESFRFEGVPADAVPSILRGFSAPILLQTAHTEEQQLFLMAHDSDQFNRWDAGQQIAESLLLKWVGESAPEMDEAWLNAIGELLADGEKDPAFIAETLMLPGERWLAEKMEVVDVVAIHQAREFAIRAIAERYQQEMVELYHKLDPEMIAGRTLRNQLLGMLMRLGSDDVVDMAVTQLEQAENMSDEMGALSALEQVDLPQRTSALNNFYDKWRDERLVVDKWFALQAGSQLPDAMNRVEALLNHPDFDITNPNRVRSLVGVFAHGNQLHFHDADGRGYRFLADQVLRLDKFNSQVAARMVGAFNQWRRYDDGRQSLMRAQLQRIADREGLSRDVYEIVRGSGLRF